MRLLFLSNVFPNPLQPTKGVFNLGMVRALRELGHDVEVICPIAWTDWIRASRARRRQLRSFQGCIEGVPLHCPLYAYTPGMLRSAYAWCMWQGVRGAVGNAISRLAPEAVVGYWAHPDGRCAIRAARQAGTPALVMVGGSDVLLLTRNRRRRRLVHAVLRDADAVVPVSDDLRQRLVADGIAPDKITVVRRGIETAKFRSGDRLAARRRLGLPDDRPLLLWVGRLTPIKGLPVLIEALRQLKQEGAAFLACLVGSGELSAVLKAQVKQCGLDRVVRFMGAVPHEQLPDWYRAADLTVLPSLSEGVPNVLLESIACGTPFVASRVGGVAEIATGGIDQLVPPGDAAALAEAIRERLTSPPASLPRTFVPDDRLQAAQRSVDVIADVLENGRAQKEAESPLCQSSPAA